MQSPQDWQLNIQARPVQRPQSLSGRGTVYSYSTVYDTPAGFEEQAPYTLALVQLDDGPMLTAQLTDLGETNLEIGMPVEMTFRRFYEGADMYIYFWKCRPIR